MFAGEVPQLFEMYFLLLVLHCWTGSLHNYESRRGRLVMETFSVYRQHEQGSGYIPAFSCALWFAALIQNNINASSEPSQELKCSPAPWRTLKE